MPVPDNTYFGERPQGGAITYGEVREVTDSTQKLILLKARMDPLLIGQINELAYNDGKIKVYSPFPLMVLTLLSIETLGHLINDLEKIKNANEHEQSKQLVRPVYQLMDRKLMYKPSKPFMEAFERLHEKPDKSIERYSDVIHKYQRNTFNHGYQARGVYLTEELTEPYLINEELGCMYIHPYMFWTLFKKTYDNVFMQILSGKNKEWTRYALIYFENLLK